MLISDKDYLKINSVRRINPMVTIMGVFLIIIFLGTFLLMLPFSTSEVVKADFLTALFTATSATCVTGLSVVDTLSYWSFFGQCVILLLIQCGGLGFMAFATVFSIVLNRKVSLRERLIISQSFSVDSLSGIVELTKKIIIRTFIAEFIGAILLSIRFIPEYGIADGMFKSIFHSVSAFCNAGFDLIGIAGEHSGSLSKYVSDPIVILTHVSLMVFGGLGFIVWEDIIRKKFHFFSLHTKLVLITTTVLLLGGTATFLLFEYTNPATFGKLSFPEKMLAALFQASTCRTAGFCSITQASLTDSSKIFSMLLMFIGGSPGSTAGGVKTVTVATLFMTAVCIMRGRTEITIFGRRISHSAVFKCIGLCVVAAAFVAVASVALVMTNDINMLDALFECISALSTTGLSTGITSTLNVPSKLILILLMYFGRVGILTISLGLIAKPYSPKIRFPEGKIIVG